MRPRPRAVFRRTLYLLIAIPLVLFASIQFQQRLLRYRAERLHAEIVALQLHPGTFADIQRMQKEWGRFAHYEGECTQHHCIYEIKLLDQYLRMSRSAWDRLNRANLPVTEEWRIDKAFEYLSLLYRAVGGRPAEANADLEVRDNHMWGVNFGMGAYTSPGVGRNEGHEYMLAAHTGLNSRVLGSALIDSKFLPLGYSDYLELHCLGCEVVSATFTAQTDPLLIKRFNQLNFNCLGPWHPCKHPEDMAPNLTLQAQLDMKLPNANSSDSDSTYCKVSIAVRAREAEDIVLVQIATPQLHTDPDSRQQYQTATAIVQQQLKNGKRTAVGSSIDFVTVASAKSFAPDEIWKKGQRLFLLYSEPKANDIVQSREIAPCNDPADTSATLAEIRSGIALDGSTGEQWDWYDLSGEPWIWR